MQSYHWWYLINIQSCIQSAHDRICLGCRMLGFIVVRGTGILYIQPEELGKEERLPWLSMSSTSWAESCIGAQTKPVILTSDIQWPLSTIPIFVIFVLQTGPRGDRQATQEGTSARGCTRQASGPCQASCFHRQGQVDRLEIDMGLVWD